MATAERIVQEARHAAHLAFDRHTWDGDHDLRPAAYRWLADQLELPLHRCHIGQFGVRRCLQVIELCERVAFPRPRKLKPRDYRARKRARRARLEGRLEDGQT